MLRLLTCCILLATALAGVPASSATTCEPSFIGQVCASVGGTVNDLPDTTAQCGPGSGDCVGFSTTGSYTADFERVEGWLSDMHITETCESATIILTQGICVINEQTTRWHDDYNDVCNPITGTATGLTSGVTAQDEIEVGPGC